MVYIHDTYFLMYECFRILYLRITVTHSVFCILYYLCITFYVLFIVCVTLPPNIGPIAVGNKYIYIAPRTPRNLSRAVTMFTRNQEAHGSNLGPNIHDLHRVVRCFSSVT
jgi:hypothetical protein